MPLSTMTIREIIHKVEEGQIRIPRFQRGFVWDPEAVARLMDSIYKSYPYGSMLFWRTREALRSERQLGPFAIPERDPDYPIDYVLDGQQRITSLFGVFQTSLPVSDGEDWFDIYFDFKADPSIQESQFMPLAAAEVDLTRHFPLKTLFDTVSYRKATEGLPVDDIVVIDELQSIFKEASIPIQTIENEVRASVAIIFERINRNGVPLDVLQLLSAWTWSEDFDLQEAFEQLSDDIRPFGFGGEKVDANLLARCCAAVIAHDAAPEALVDLDGEDVRRRFAEVSNGVKGAIDFLRSSLHVYTIENLPFVTLLVPLSVFYAVQDGEQLKMDGDTAMVLRRWFWRSCFSRRYSSGVLRNLRSDILEMDKLRRGSANTLGDFDVSIDSKWFIDSVFRFGSVNTKTFVLQLAQHQPRSFISGQPVSLQKVLQEYNRNEFHHVFPRKFLKDSGQATDLNDSVLANFAFLSRSDNNSIGGRAPIDYVEMMPKTQIAEIVASAMMPDRFEGFTYRQFVEHRSEVLADDATRLLGGGSSASLGTSATT